mgnify:CR=1 FL=1
MSETGARRGRRGGGRAGRQASRSSASATTTAYLERRLPPVEMLDEDGLAQIEDNAETILAEVGIAFQITDDLIELPEGLFKGQFVILVGHAMDRYETMSSTVLRTVPSRNRVSIRSPRSS